MSSKHLDRSYAALYDKDANSQAGHFDPRSLGNSDKHVRFIQTFKPLPWQKAFLNDLSPVVLLTGSAGGGKSHVAAEKIHLACLKYPNVEALIVRKIQEDVMDSSYNLLKKKVVGKDRRVEFRAQSAEYFNGSTIYFIGMRGEREREAVRSIGTGAVCLVWIEEAHETEEEDFDELLGRIRGKQMGWTQLILTTNPNIPLHYIRRRLIIGEEAKVYISSEQDNPYNDDNYKKRLHNMKGVKGQRLRDGLWVEATGQVISTFVDDWHADNRVGDPVGNVTDKADYNPDGRPIEIWADNGYAGEWDDKSKMFTTRSHPRVFLVVQQTPEGFFNVIAESYQVQMQEMEHLRLLEEMCKKNGWDWPPMLGVYDSASPSLGSYMMKAGIRSVKSGTKNLDDSIDLLRSTIAPDLNGIRNIRIHPRCKILRMEILSWTYDKNGRPGKFMDNGPDCLRYGVYHHRGPDVGESDIGVGQSDVELDRMMAKIDEEYDRFIREVGINI